MSGEPIEGASVSPNSFVDGISLIAQTDGDGNFRFSVASGSMWIFSARAEGYDIRRRAVVVAGDVSLGEVPLDRLLLSVRGRVLDENGEPVPAVVRLEGAETVYVTRTDPGSGRFTIPNVPYGEEGVLVVETPKIPPDRLQVVGKL